MYSSYVLLSLVASIVAAPSPARIEIDVMVEDNAAYGASLSKSIPLGKHALESYTFCIPFYNNKCAFEGTSFDCCPPLSCVDDGSGDDVKRCLEKDDDQDQHASTHKPKHQPKLAITDDDNDNFCLPPWEDGRMICGIGQPKYKCCDPDIFECKQFGRSAMYGCQRKGDGDDDDGALSPLMTSDDNICLPPWEIARMVCGIGQPKYKCCRPDMECKKIASWSEYYGCLSKNKDRGEGVLKKMGKDEHVFKPELL